MRWPTFTLRCCTGSGLATSSVRAVRSLSPFFFCFSNSASRSGHGASLCRRKASCTKQRSDRPAFAKWSASRARLDTEVYPFFSLQVAEQRHGWRERRRGASSCGGKTELRDCAYIRPKGHPNTSGNCVTCRGAVSRAYLAGGIPEKKGGNNIGKLFLDSETKCSSK